MRGELRDLFSNPTMKIALSIWIAALLAADLHATDVAQCLQFTSPANANGTVSAFATYDDGTGPALYVGGGFTTIGGIQASRIAKWDGTQWSALGLGLTGTGGVHALCVYDDGSGPVLVAGGAFDNAGGIPSGGIAAWNGASWSAFGSGFGNSDPLFGNSRRVRAVAVYEGELYAGGYFDSPAHILARWNGSSWTGLGGFLWNCEEYEEAVFAFQVFDDGSGPALYAGGSFIFGVGGDDAVVRWNGTQLSPVGSLFGIECPGAVHALEADADSVANGGRLYAGGWMNATTSNVWAWNGSAWQGLGSAVGVTSLEMFDDGTGDGASLYADVWENGQPTRIKRWDGAAWQVIADVSPTLSAIQSLYAFDDAGDGADLWIGGNLSSIDGVAVQRLAKYTGCGGLGEGYCFGDGSLPTPCPCASPDTVPIPGGAPGAGCANSFNLGGAMLSAVGATTPDTVRFVGRVGRNYAGFGFLLKGSAADLNGVASHDGIRCVDGALLRVGAHNAGTYGAPLGTWTYPNNVQTLSVHVATAQQYGQDAHYQLFYRNAVPGFCTAATANFSNAVRIGWH
jgi:hypothetical protein